MTRKKLSFDSVRAYAAPAMELSSRALMDMLCDSGNDGYTEDLGDVEDFTW